MSENPYYNRVILDNLRHINTLEFLLMLLRKTLFLNDSLFVHI